MEFQPKVLPYAYEIKTIDSHTMGESTRIVYDGFPYLPGDTMMEKKKYLMENYDFLRSALMLEPRGHRDMFGALLTQPVHEEAYTEVVLDAPSGLIRTNVHVVDGKAKEVSMPREIRTANRS